MYRKCKDNFGNESNSILLIKPNGLIVSIPPDPANTDYQEYLQWLDDGNTPEEAQ